MATYDFFDLAGGHDRRKRMNSARGSVGSKDRCLRRSNLELLLSIPVFPCAFATEVRIKIVAHPESHIVKLDDGSTWQIFPGDIDHTLAWLPTTELRLFEMNDEIASHALINCVTGPACVRAPMEKNGLARKLMPF